MKYYEINREERHFGFLFMSALIFNKQFRETVFESINKRSNILLDPNDFDIYAEVALFRDYWYSLGDHKNYEQNDLHEKRLNALKIILQSMGLDEKWVHEYKMFWTKNIGTSKLWFPGKWSEDKIKEIEKEKNVNDKKLWRCRWLCNAKPDILIQSKNDFVFIEIKVESGLGSSELGYDQKQTQEDIILVAKELFGWPLDSNFRRIELTNKGKNGYLTWENVKTFFHKTMIENEIGSEMIFRHFANMPSKQI